ncbi:MAG: TonB family protein [Terriglobales bacterium]
MFPQPMSRSEIGPDASPRDLPQILEQHLRGGFPLDLALDLVLNELVVRAATATHATAAALALVRGNEMVCRAATGPLAPDLGIPINTRDGLSGACLETRQPQLSVDTEFDPRVDPAVSRRLGIRSILIVPVFDSYPNRKDRTAEFTGILEVFSASPAAFSSADQKVLEGFAEECARIRQAAIELSQRNPVAAVIPPEPVPLDFVSSEHLAVRALPPHRSSYEAWTLVLGSLVILASIALSFLVGSRIGWLRPTPSRAEVSQPVPAAAIAPATTPAGPANHPSKAKTEKSSSPPTSAPAASELVVYEKGKVIFRMKPAPSKPNSDSIVEASSTSKIAPTQSVWLAPEQAETHLLSRTEPQYPPEALAAHRSGNVLLEVHVAEDGSVSNIRTLSGDPVLANAAKEAVHNWRYQPYRKNDHPTRFQTDVTLSFNLPN